MQGPDGGTTSRLLMRTLAARRMVRRCTGIPDVPVDDHHPKWTDEPVAIGPEFTLSPLNTPVGHLSLVIGALIDGGNVMVFADLGLSLLASATYDGLKRPIETIHGRLTRRAEIIDAYENNSSIDLKKRAEIKSAIDELTAVLGNQYGNYTEIVDEFLLDLKSSAVPSLMYKLLLCDRDVDTVRPAFDVVYKSYDGLPFTGDQLFRALAKAISARIEAKVRDPSLLAVVRAQANDLRDQLISIEKALRDIREPSPDLTPSKYREAKLRVARSVELENQYLPVETDRGTKRVLISKLVIPARLRYTDANNPAAPATLPADVPALSLTDFRRRFSRAVILGDPGGGKTTFTQYLCWEMSKKIGISANPSSSKSLDPHELRVPLRIVLRTFDRKQRSASAYSIVDHLCSEIKTALDNDSDAAGKFLQRALSVGQAIVLFDGLDEILDVERRREMVRHIEQFCNAYPACQALVTSRVVGYRDAPLDDSFDAFVLSQLNVKEVESFASKWIKAIKGCTPKIASELAQLFVQQTNSNASDLRSNPLLLGLMVYLFSERGDVPDNRPAIYQACSHLLFFRWDQRRDIKFEYPDDFELMDLFGYIAVQVFGDPDAEDGVTTEWLSSQMKEFFRKWYSDQARAVAASRSLVEFITGRAWVMCDIGPGRYKFTHRTFMEYFVARRLESESENAADLLNSLYTHIVAAEWDVVSHLALQIAANSGPKALKAVEALQVKMAKSGRSNRSELNFLQFFVRAMEYLPVPDTKYLEVTHQIIDRMLKIVTDRDLSALSILPSLVRYSKKKRLLLEETLQKFIDQAVVSSDGMKSRIGKVLLGTDHAYMGRDRLFMHPDMTWHDVYLPTSLISPIRTKHKERLRDEASKSVYAARMYGYLFPHEFAELYHEHGPRLLFMEIAESMPPAFLMAHLSLFVEGMNDLHGGTRRAMKSPSATVLRTLTEAGLGGSLMQIPVRSGSARSMLAIDLLQSGLRNLWVLGIQAPRERLEARIGDYRVMFAAYLIFVEFELGSLKRRSKKRVRPQRLLIETGPEDVVKQLVGLAKSINELSFVTDWLDGRMTFFEDVSLPVSNVSTSHSLL